METKKLRRQPINLVNKSRWVAYATAGAAAALAGVNSADADIHYSGLINDHVQGTVGTPDFPMFPLTGGQSFGLIHVAANSSSGIARFVLGGTNGTFASAGFRGFVANSYAYAAKLASNADVAAGAFIMSTAHSFGTMAFRGGYGNDQWLAAGTGFIGFEFNLGGGLQYGWARVTMDGSPQNSFTLVDYAWGDVGTAVSTGQTVVPEPGSLGLLALGGAGLLAWRKRRGQAAPKS